MSCAVKVNEAFALREFCLLVIKFSTWSTRFKQHKFYRFRGGQGLTGHWRELQWLFFAFQSGVTMIGCIMSDDSTHTPNPDQNFDAPMPENGEANEHQPIFNLPTVIVAIVCTCVALHVLRMFVLSQQWHEWLFLNFAFFPVRYTPEYFAFDFPTLWSPIGSTLLHADWAHLGLNMIWLIALGSPVAYRLGWLRSLVFWVLTALGAILLHTFLYYGDSVPLIGASGAVSGFMGAAARFGFRSNRANPRAGLAGPLYGPLEALRLRGVLPFLLIWMVLNWAFGSDLLGLAGGSSIAWEAHIGGLITGYFAIAWLDWRRM